MTETTPRHLSDADLKALEEEFDPEARFRTVTRPVAILCIGHVEAFYPRPMLELEQWAERMPIDSVMAENAWPDAS